MCLSKRNNKDNKLRLWGLFNAWVVPSWGTNIQRNTQRKRTFNGRLQSYKSLNNKGYCWKIAKPPPPPFPKMAVEGHNFYKVWIGQYYEPYALHVSFLFNVLNY